MKDQNYNENDIITTSIAELICRHPRLKVANGTLEEVYAFLQGCNSIILSFNLKVTEPTPQDALNWIYTENNKLGGGLDLARLRSKYGSDDATLANLLEGIRDLKSVTPLSGDNVS